MIPTATALRETTWTLDAGPCAPAVARALVRDTLHAWGLPRLIDDARLLVSELVANAVQHARPAIVLSVHRGNGIIRVEVVDHGPVWVVRPPVPLADVLDAEHGRGLAIVAAYATRWGVDPLPAEGGKAVWFLLATAVAS